ncbi:MAG: sigma-70 family RNA polymerase sigma factor [Planctomycetes bacterium]|nr:sigma-70 family RNA polymerase sigma factor [Planctomycetota bacterium]
MATAEFTRTVELLRAAQAGDDASLRRLVERYRPRILERVRRLMSQNVRRWAESVDFAQMVLVDFLSEYERLEIEDEKSLMRWLTAVARNTIRDEARRRRARGIDTLIDGSLPAADHGFEPIRRSGTASRVGTPPSHADRSEQNARLHEALTCLSPESLAVVRGRMAGRTFRDIAGSIGKSENATQLIHARALRKLGQILGD